MNFLLKLAIVRWAIEQTKFYTLPGFAGISIYDMVYTFRKEVKQDLLLLRAGALTFNFMMSLFPTIIFFFTLLPYVPIKDLDDRILEFFLLPNTATIFVSKTIHDLVHIKRGGLLSTGFLLAIFFSSNGIMSMQRAFDRSDTHSWRFTRRSAFQKRLTAILLVFTLSFLFTTSLVFIVGGALLVKYIGNLSGVSAVSYYLLVFIRWAAILGLFYGTFSIIYRYVPSVQRRFPFLSGGAVVATLGSLITSAGFSYFANNFGSYNKVYGAVGTIIVLMIWFNFNARVLLVGFEVNLTIAQILAKRAHKHPEFNPENILPSES
jgi:membrane protein